MRSEAAALAAAAASKAAAAPAASVAADASGGAAGGKEGSASGSEGAAAAAVAPHARGRCDDVDEEGFVYTAVASTRCDVVVFSRAMIDLTTDFAAILDSFGAGSTPWRIFRRLLRSG